MSRLHASFAVAFLGVLVQLAPFCPAAPPAGASAGIARPAQPQAIMPVDEVRIGMRGYGMTVFAGTKIEPFAVEVVSVMRDFTPQGSVIWVRCPDERMQQSGAVQGMSGSPIYLWSEGEPQEPGKGGRLIGAFAFGFGLSKDCFVGVQPIEAMRAAGQRAQDQAHDPASASAGGARLTLAHAIDAARGQGLTDAAMWRARAVQRVTASFSPSLAASAPAAAPAGQALFRTPAHQLKPMMLPMSVPSAELAQFVAPLLEPLGLSPMAGAAPAGKPPVEVKPETIQLAPGSVLSVPLAWGDLDLSAVGTVTDVLPDGRVLGFGHAMFGRGPTAVPMATGFVHFIQPNLMTSFKLGGTAMIRGALVRDESSAVVGTSEGRYTSAPVRVEVQMPGQPDRTYHYRVVHQRDLTPMLAAMVAMQSISAVQAAPPLSTLRLNASFKFNSGHTITARSTVPESSPTAVVMQMAPALFSMLQNPFQPVELESVQITARVEPGLRSGTLVDARLSRAEVQPGQRLNIAVNIQPYGKPITTRHISLRVPASMPEGDYPLLICDPASYAEVFLGTRPHLMKISSLDELHRTLTQVQGISDTSLYVLLQSPYEGLAVGRQELPMLPSSRRAMIATPTSTAATPFPQWITTVEPLDLVPQGQLAFTVSVRKSHADLPDDGKAGPDKPAAPPAAKPQPAPKPVPVPAPAE